MPVADSPIIIAAVVFYLAVCAVIGVWAMRRTHTISDFLMAGQSLSGYVVVIAAMSSTMSGFGFVGGPGLVFESGASSWWMVFVVTIGAAQSWTLAGKRLRLISESREILTLPDAVAARYGGRMPRLMMGLAVLLGVLGYLGTQVVAVAWVLIAVFGVSQPVAMTIGLAVLAFYSIAGGILAGVYTDLFQGVLMVIAAVAVFYYALESGGGMAEISRTLWAMDPESIGPWGTRGAVTAMGWYLLFGLGAVGQPHTITKLMMLRDIRDLRWGAFQMGAAYSVLALLWMSIGLAMRALVLQGKQAPLENPDLAAPAFLLGHTPELLAGIVFAGLLAAIMSTADSFLNIGAAAIVRDIPTAVWGAPLPNELFWTRVVTGVILVASALFALYMESLVALLGTFGWGTFAAAIVPSIAIGLNWKRATAAACTWSIAVSIFLNFALELSARHEVYSLPNGLPVGAVALTVSLAIFVGVSLMTPEPEIPEDVLAAMEV